MTKKWKKVLRIGIIASPIAASVIGVGIYYISKKNSSSSKLSDKPLGINVSTKYDLNEKVKIFPKLSSFDFYNQIKIKNSKPIITDEFIAKVINKIILETKYTTGVIRWEVKKVSPQSIVLSFMWDPNNSGLDKNGDGQKAVWCSYTISLSNDI